MGVSENQIKAESWSRIIKAKESSGLKTMEFCRQQGLSRYQFDYWRKRLRKVPVPSLVNKELAPFKKSKSFVKAEVLASPMVRDQRKFSLDPKWVAEFLLHLQGGLG